MKLIYLIASVNLLPFSRGHHCGPPRQTLAGISVPDTSTIRNAMALASKYNDQTIYNHVIRSWLFGSAILQNDPLYNATADQEVHAVAALLHDISLDPRNSETASPGTRYEVDGANVARKFIRDQTDGESWDERRVQLLWDAIALHTEVQIAREKEIEVKMVNAGITVDITGGDGLPAEMYQTVLKAYPMLDLFENVKEKLVQICKAKPASTYGELSPIMLLLVKLT